MRGIGPFVFQDERIGLFYYVDRWNSELAVTIDYLLWEAMVRWYSWLFKFEPWARALG